MPTTNDKEFKERLAALDAGEQRQVEAQYAILDDFLSKQGTQP